MRNKLVIDLDGTICSLTNGGDQYFLALPKIDVITKVNELFEQNWDVTIFTARGMCEFSGDLKLIEEKYRIETEKWLKENGVNYSRLIFGKPSGDMYVDDKAVTLQKFCASDKKVFTNGCFDVLHKAHVALFRRCRELAGKGKVIVGINSDDSVKRLKGKGRPVNNEIDRAEIIKCISFVDEVIIFNEDTPRKLLEALRPDIIVKGGDYTPDNVVGNDIAEVVIFPTIIGYSSTKTIGELRNE